MKGAAPSHRMGRYRLATLSERDVTTAGTGGAPAPVTGASPLAAVRAEPGLSASARREAWQALTRPLFAASTLTAPDEFAAAWTLHQLGRLVVSQVEFSAQEFIRDPRRHQPADDELLLLELYEAGSGRGYSGELPTFIDPHHIHLVDMSRSYRTVTTATRTIGVVLPHEAVRYDPRRYPPYLSLPMDTPRGAILAAALRMLAKQLPAVTTAEAPALSEAFAGLVHSLLLAPIVPASMAEAHFPGAAARVRGFIDRHLADELDVDQLQRRFGMSRATLYRLFRTQGGVETYIRDRRLDRCSVELMQAAPARGRVREVAERMGFIDAGHFTRSYRQRFGVAPTDHLGARLRMLPGTIEPAPAAAPHNSVSLFAEWLRRQVPASPDAEG